MADQRPDDELLAAYVDGVGELTPEERKRVEARLGELDVAGTKGMIEQLRALPPEGNEPDWRMLHARIGKAIDDAPRPWWRRWFVPAGGLAVVVGAALLMLTVRHDDVTAPPPVAVKAPVKAPTIDAAVPVPAAQATELWLDGQLVDVSDVDPEALFGDLDVPDAIADDTTDVTVDQLDDKALDNLDRWLERKKS
jgi:anti-sigma factor RsiW